MQLLYTSSHLYEAAGKVKKVKKKEGKKGGSECTLREPGAKFTLSGIPGAFLYLFKLERILYIGNYIGKASFSATLL